MKKRSIRRMVICGIVCVLLMVFSVGHSVVYNDSRLVAPMNFSEYEFRAGDLPMMISGGLLVLYLICLLVLLVPAVIRNKNKAAAAQTTRRLNPNLGFLGFAGFLGFLGFWTYRIDKTVFPFVFFMFFGFFGFFYEGKMSNVFMDERYKENKMKAHLNANKIALAIIFAAAVILGQGKLIANLEYTLIAFVIVTALSIALKVFLSEYLLYKYDDKEPFNESEE